MQLLQNKEKRDEKMESAAKKEAKAAATTSIEMFLLLLGVIKLQQRVHTYTPNSKI